MSDHQALIKNAFLWSLFIENISLQQGYGWQWKMLDALVEKNLPYPDVAKARQATNGWPENFGELGYGKGN